MRKIITYILISLMIVGSVLLFSACGGDSSEGTDASTQENVTEETVQAADPMTEEEMETDDSGGCIEDSEDLLY